MKTKMTFFLNTIFVAFMINVSVLEAREFKVGDDLGWKEPGANDTSMYNQWAERNRFQIGDSLDFEYKNDSVLRVKKWGYYHCDTNKPIIAYNNGKSIFKLDRAGPFYFISASPNHCKNGQRLLVEVLSPHSSPPSPADAPQSSYPAPAPCSGTLLSAPFSTSLFLVLISTLAALLWPSH